MDINSYASQKLRELRIKKRISQQELAEELGITQQQIARFENNKRQFKQDFLFKVAEYFNVSINYFFPETNNNDLDKIISDKVQLLNDEQKKKVIDMIEIIK